MSKPYKNTSDAMRDAFDIAVISASADVAGMLGMLDSGCMPSEWAYRRIYEMSVSCRGMYETISGQRCPPDTIDLSAPAIEPKEE